MLDIKDGKLVIEPKKEESVSQHVEPVKNRFSFFKKKDKNNTPDQAQENNKPIETVSELKQKLELNTAVVIKDDLEEINNEHIKDLGIPGSDESQLISPNEHLTLSKEYLDQDPDEEIKIMKETPVINTSDLDTEDTPIYSEPGIPSERIMQVPEPDLDESIPEDEEVDIILYSEFREYVIHVNTEKILLRTLEDLGRCKVSNNKEDKLITIDNETIDLDHIISWGYYDKRGRQR